MRSLEGTFNAMLWKLISWPITYKVLDSHLYPGPIQSTLDTELQLQRVYSVIRKVMFIVLPEEVRCNMIQAQHVITFTQCSVVTSIVLSTDCCVDTV